MDLGANHVEQERQHGLVEGGFPLGVGLFGDDSISASIVVAAAARSASFGGTSPPRDHLVSHHAAEPVAKTASRGIVAEHGLLLEDGQHHVLNDFLGRVFGAAALPGDGEDERPVAMEEVVPDHRIGAVVEAFEQAGSGVCA